MWILSVPVPDNFLPYTFNNLDYCINTGAARYSLPCINGNKSRVLIMEFS